MEDFSMSSLASQHGALTFIDEGSTRRKEIIAKFLDLEQFDKKFKLAKEDSIDARGALKKLENRNYDEELEQAKVELKDCRSELKINEDRCKLFATSLGKFEKDLSVLQNAVDSAPTEMVNHVELVTELQKKNNQLISLQLQIKENEQNIEDKNFLHEKTLEIIESFDYEGLLHKKDKAEKFNENLKSYLDNIAELEKQLKRSKKKMKLLEGIPCGDTFPTCKFIRDANASVARLPTLEEECEKIAEKQEVMEQMITDLNPDHVKALLLKYDRFNEEKDILSGEISEYELQNERNANAIVIIQHEIEKLEDKIQEYNDNREAIENLESLLKQKRNIEEIIKTQTKEFEECQQETYELYRQIGSYEQRVESTKEAKKEYLTLQREYAAYDLFMGCMHPNGIAYDVIKKKIPVINQEIAKVLANIVDFEIFFESNGNKLDIFIKHPKHDERPIEMASGAEKTMAAMAIRLSLLSISSLPKGDLFILDEPGTALDEENMEGFIRILELIKVYFKNVLLISHLDSLKDCVDMQIVIEKKRGYARVNQ